MHAGTHATTVLKGLTIVDALMLGPLDVILGPGNEPHGPLEYPEGCQLFSAFVGSYFHSEVEALAERKHYRLIQSAQIPWLAGENGLSSKTLVDHGCGPVLLEALQLDAGAEITKPTMLAGLVVEGETVIDEERLGHLDFFYVCEGVEHAPLRFPRATTLLTVTVR